MLEEVEPSPVEPSIPGAESSIVDLLKQDYKELSEVTDVYIHVEGYERSGLQIRYRLPESGKELDTIAQKVMRNVKDNFSRNILIATDTIATLCDGLYVQPEDADEPHELDPQETGEPVRFDPRLATILGMPDPDTCGARAVVRKLFGDNDLKLLNHAEKLNRWLMNSKADLESEFWQLGG